MASSVGKRSTAIRVGFQSPSKTTNRPPRARYSPPYLATITARTLIVHGDRDPIYPVRLALEMYEAIPRSYLWVIPNGEHGTIFMMAERFNETALAFLRGDWEKQ